MPVLDLNYLAVLAAAASSMIIGMLWYSQLLFGNTWMSLVGKSKEELGNATNAYLLTFLGALVTAFVLDQFIVLMDAVTVRSGVKLGLWIWFGFVVTSGLSEYLFNGKPRALYFINMGYHFVVLTVMGAILATWR